MPDGMLKNTALASEMMHVLRLLDTHPAIRWDRLLFSAKESVFKAWFPLTRRWLGFDDAEIAFDVATGTFRAELLVVGPVVDEFVALSEFTGRWLARHGLVVTVVAIAT